MYETPFFLIFLAATADAAQAPQFAGHWQNTNPRNEIVALDISLKGSGRLTVRAWALREGSVGDWGIADAVASTPLGNLTAQSLTATFQLPDRKVILIVQFENPDAQVLRVTVKTHFTDNSGRLDISESDRLRREPRPGAPAGQATTVAEPHPPSPPGSTASAPTRPEPTAAAPHTVSGRAFLVGSAGEESGFGLYSYLLLGSAPASDAMRRQYLSVVEEYLKLLTEVGSLEGSGLPKNELNVTYLLLTERPTVRQPTPDWVLDHYNFARAKAILAISGRNDMLTGPYLISALVPMSHLTRPPSHLLLQDMSHCTSDVAASWIEEFERRAGQAEFWKDDTRNQAILGLRTFVSNAAAGLVAVGQSTTDFKKLVAGWITWN
jgi:hypothetical protein